MSNKRRRKKKNNNGLTIGLFIILIILMLISVGIFLLKDKNDDKATETEKLFVEEQTNEESSQESQGMSDVSQYEVESYEIETKYCKFYFPKIWEEQIEVKYSEEFGYKAEFYGIIEGKESKHLFDICFNSDDGDLLGYLEDKDGIINISIDVMELQFDDSWKQEDIDQIYSMQEEMNFVIESLSKNGNYVEP